AVIADCHVAERHEIPASGKLVQVEEYHLVSRVHVASATVDRILLPLLRAAVVPPAIPAVRHREIGLLYPAKHLVVELLLQWTAGFQHRIGVSVLGFKILAHGRIALVAKP